MKAYGIPMQTAVVWKPTNTAPTAAASAVTVNGANSLIGAFVKSDSIVRTVSSCSNDSSVTPVDSVVNSKVNGTTSITVKQEVPDLEAAACHLTSKQLEEFMDDDCHGPVSSGDPMLSSPHLSPHGILPSPASSGSHYSANDDALTPDSMDLAV